MANILNFAPTFTPGSSGAGTLNFSRYSGFSLRNLTAVINETKGVLIYCPANGIAFGYTAFNSGTSTITLSFDTSTHSSGDVLSCVYGIEAATPTTSCPNGDVLAPPVRQTPSDIWKDSFTGSGSGLVSTRSVLMATGSGMAVSQALGSLVITTGTTTKAETLIRSAKSFTNAIIGRAKVTTSQRIANQNFAVWLADLVGEGLSYTADGTGLNITVTIPSNPFTTQNVGQSISLSVISGGGPAGRYTITSVSGNNVTFSPIFNATWTRSTTTATVTAPAGAADVVATQAGAVTNTSDATAIVNGAVTVASAAGTTFTFTCLNAGALSGTLTYQNTAMAFSASETGTLTIWGWNYLRAILRDTTTTAALYDTCRNGWQSGDSSTTIGSSSTGTILQLQTDGVIADFGDVVVASSTTYAYNSRGTRAENIPDDETPLYLFLQAKNATVAPASTTTLTVGFSLVEAYYNVKMMLAGAAQYGNSRGLQLASTTTIATVAAVTDARANAGMPVGVNDITSGTRTTTTGSTITPAFGAAQAYNIAVTAVTGSGILDWVVEESLDDGANWVSVYQFPRISATGSYSSPVMAVTGTRVRINSTLVSGTSHTASIRRVQLSQSAPIFRQIYDRATIVLTTGSSTSTVLYAEGCAFAELELNLGAATTAPVIQLQGSTDNTNWKNLGRRLLGVASSTVSVVTKTNANKFIRAIVVTAGATVTAGYTLIRASSLPFRETTAAAAPVSVTSFTSVTSAQLLAANDSRVGYKIRNEGAGVLYVLEGTGTASATNYSYVLNSGDQYVSNDEKFALTGIFVGAGTARVTENF